MKELLEKILNRPSDYYVYDYVEEEFKREYQLISKLNRLLTIDEFTLLHRMCMEEEYELYKLVDYFNKSK